MLQFCCMQIVIAATEAQIEQAGIDTTNAGHTFHVVDSAAAFAQFPAADVLVDFGFEGIFLSEIEKPLLISETLRPLTGFANLPNKVARFCGWPTLVGRPLWEMAATPADSNWLKPVMDALGKQLELVADVPGLVAPRILSRIINEAYFALAEKVSDTAEIDTAMKLGTNYPLGPFEWAQKIGHQNIYQLLQKLAETQSLYTPYALLAKAFQHQYNK